jgi:hypothetical protein
VWPAELFKIQKTVNQSSAICRSAAAYIEVGKRIDSAK